MQAVRDRLGRRHSTPIGTVFFISITTAIFFVTSAHGQIGSGAPGASASVQVQTKANDVPAEVQTTTFQPFLDRHWIRMSRYFPKFRRTPCSVMIPFLRFWVRLTGS